jgi:26S proteasome regulatory subunit T5
MKTLKDFLGNKETIEDIESIVLNMSGGMMFRFMGVTPDKSFLLYGPNGLGKTHSIDCIQGELVEKGLNPFRIEYSIGRYGTAYINMGSKRINDMFLASQKFLKEGKYDCAIYVIDEAETLMTKRGESHKEDDKVLSTLMTNLQELHDRETEEYVFLMTNFPQMIDSASLRSGRIDRKVEFKLPDTQARIGLFRNSIEELNRKAGYNVVRGQNLEQLASESEGFNCADCVEIPKRAVKQRAIELLKEKKDKIIKLGYVNQKRLLDKVREQRKVYSKTNKRKIGF